MTKTEDITLPKHNEIRIDVAKFASMCGDRCRTGTAGP